MDNITAKQLANEIIGILKPACTRIEIAGSIRRGKPEVKDIEIVCLPDLSHKPRPEFGSAQRFDTALDKIIFDWTRSTDWEPLKSGDRYKQFYSARHNINLGLFIVRPPAQWGVIYTIRTGPSDFSQWVVTPRVKGGALPNEYSVAMGGVYRTGNLSALAMPEEQDFLDFLGLGWMEPSERAARWNFFRGERLSANVE